ncbi:hypothetical protein GSS87_09090 [Corynebacterium sp. 4HC-13]|uniref:hypothetical protein n=1 Tax=Corynebacterium anserum TaxID=2684406 RepID=UPI0016395ED2|nr:hypothetical protein [Corynebacterium anserum]MBC2682538.1 hypothetical protein [Corynebacterium anserum]
MRPIKAIQATYAGMKIVNIASAGTHIAYTDVNPTYGGVLIANTGAHLTYGGAAITHGGTNVTYVDADITFELAPSLHKKLSGQIRQTQKRPIEGVRVSWTPPA